MTCTTENIFSTTNTGPYFLSTFISFPLWYFYAVEQLLLHPKFTEIECNVSSNFYVLDIPTHWLSMAQNQADSRNQELGTFAEQESSWGDATVVQLDEEACKHKPCKSQSLNLFGSCFSGKTNKEKTKS